jgi:pyruvate formate lyase activating enzyme
MSNHKVIFWQNKDDKLQCRVCPHNCILKEDQYGVCKVRKNENNEIVAINYGEVTSASIDPIEKKPLYHYKPGNNIFSLGTFGCNMSCSFCQNYSISQYKPETQYINIEKLIETIDSMENNVGVAFTYNEPFMWYEYIYEAAKKIKEYKKEISVVLVTNGYVNEEPLRKILPFIDVMNIDLKSFNESYYNKLCGAKLDPVLKTIEIASKHCHIEITTLVVDKENDSSEEIEDIAKFIGNINKDIPLHLSRYFPNYQMENPPTEINKITEGMEIAKKHLNYVYVGNVSGIDNNTYCHECNELLINREMYTAIPLISNNICPKCNTKINIIF